MKRKSISSLAGQSKNDNSSEYDNSSEDGNLSDVDILRDFKAMCFTSQQPSNVIKPEPVYAQEAKCVIDEQKGDFLNTSCTDLGSWFQ